MAIKKSILFICTLVCLCLFQKQSSGQNTTFKSGTAIIDMGTTSPTIKNSLRPYGLIYTLLKNKSVPVSVVVNASKVKDGIDFVYNSKSYKGGTFIISADYISSDVQSILTTWSNQGVLIDYTNSNLTVNVTYKINFVPKWVMDRANGYLAVNYLNNAGIPSSAYTSKTPAQLDGCDDIFIMPHADPTWATHGSLLDWNRVNKGNMYIGCHAVSVLESLVDPFDATRKMNFLSTNGLLSFKIHNNTSIPFANFLPADPIAQFFNITDGAQFNGSENSYLPKPGSAWNPGAKIITTSPTQTDVPTNSPGPAVENIYGRAFDDNNRGYVAYQAGHNLTATGTLAEQIAAQRVFFNYSFFSLTAKIPPIITTGITGPDLITSGVASTTFSSNVTGSGTGFTYQWSASIPGTFSGGGTAANVTFTPTAPLNPNTATACVITVKVTESCGRVAFDRKKITVVPPPADHILTNTTIVKAIADGCTSASVTFNVLIEDPDPDAGPRTLVNVTGLGNGTVITSTNGDVTFTVDANFKGITTGNYVVTNGLSNSPAGVIQITVGDATLAPILARDISSALVDQVTEISVLNNDIDKQGAADGSHLYIKDISTKPTKGYAYINTNGTLSYLSKKDQTPITGGDLFQYLACNTVTGYCSVGTVSITLVQDACLAGQYQNTLSTTTNTQTFEPVANSYIQSSNATTNFGNRTTVSINGDFASEMRPLFKFDLSSIDTRSTVISANISLTTAVDFTPDFLSTPFPTTIYSLTKAWVEGEVTWNKYTTASTWTGPGGDFTVAGGDPVIPSAFADNGVTVVPAGTIVVSPEIKTLIQPWIITPANNFGLIMLGDNNSGPFEVQFHSKTAATAGNRPKLNLQYSSPPACLTIPVTYIPVVYPDAVVTTSALSITISPLANDANYYGNTNKITAITGLNPLSGTATITPDGLQIIYTPSGNYVGIDSLKYTVTDQTNLTTNTGVVRITVTRVPPTVVNDAATTLSSQLVTIQVGNNDSDPQGGTLGAPVIIRQPSNGTAVLNINGTDIDYTPSPGFTGTDNFQYRRTGAAPDVCTAAQSGTATVTVTVTNRPPTANNFNVTTFACAPIDINLKNNASDPEGGLLTVAIIGNPTKGTLTANANGTYKYSPNTNYSGPDAFTYQVTDPLAATSAIRTVSITVTSDPNPNTAPVANADSDNTLRDQPVYTNVLLNDSDPNNDALTLSITGAGTVLPISGTIVLLGNNLIQYTPNAGFVGTDTYRYKITDSHPDCSGTGSLSAIGVVTIKVTAIATTLSGTVWNDVNRSGQPDFSNINPTLSESGTNGNGSLNVYLVDNTNTILDKTPVDIDGTYKLSNVPSATSGLKLLLSNEDIAIGNTIVTPALPNGYVNSSPLTRALVTTTLADMGPYDWGIYTSTILTPGSLTGPPDLCGTSGTPGTLSTTGNASGGSLTATAYKYQWQSSTTGVGGSFTDISVADSLTSYTPSAPINATTYYRRRVITVNAAWQQLDAAVFTNVITVNLNPLPTITGTLSVCVNATTSLIGSATAALINPWVSANTLTATVSSLGVVTGISQGTVIITYTNTNGCSKTALVTVNPLPTISGTSSVCIGSTTALTGSGTAATLNPWVSSNTAVATVNGSGVVTGVSAGSTTITYTNNNGCLQTVTVTVNALPTISGTASVCIRSTTALTGSGTAAILNPWVSSNTAVATVSGSGVVTGVSAGSTTITYTNNNGCLQTVTVTVNPLPTISGTSSVCIGSTTALTGSGTAATLNPWVSSNTAVATVNGSGVVTGVSAGSTTITYTNNNGCFQTVTVTVNALPTISGTASVCIGSITALTGSGTAATLNPWVSSNTAVATVNGSGVVTGVSAGSTTITYTNNNGCFQTVTVTVNALPTISGTASVCIGSTTALTGSGTAATLNPWVSSNTAVATVNGSGVVTGVSAGSTTITYTNNNGCFQTVTVNVNALPTVTVTPTSVSITSGISTTLSASGALSYTWSPSTGLSATNTATVIASPISTTMYTVAGTATTTGCINTASVTVTVIGPGVIGTDQSNCGTFTPATLSSTTDASGGTPITYQWQSSTSSDFSSGVTTIAGATASTYSPGAVSATTYYRRVATFNGSSYNSNIVTVTIKTPPTATASNNSPICAGTTLNLTSSGGLTYSWTGPNSFTFAVQNPSITNTTVAASGTYTVTVTAANGCTAISTTSVTVNAKPTVIVSPAATAITTGTTLTLTASGATTYAWSPTGTLSSGVTAAVLASPLTTTVYTVTGTNASSCTNTATSTITVNPGLAAGGIGVSQAICIGSTPAAFTSTTLATGGTGTVTYQWQTSTTSATAGFTDISGATATAYTPTGAFTQTTYYRRGAKTSVDAITYTAALTITVNAKPTVTVSPVITTITLGGTVTLTASGATTYAWSPATNLSAATGATVLAGPLTATVYTVTGTDGNGCTNTATSAITVNPALTPGAIGTNQVICTGLTPASFTSSTAASGGTGTITYQWQSSTTSATAGFTDISGATATTYAPGAALAQTTYYRRGAKTTVDAIIYTTAITVAVNPLPTVTITPTSITIAAGSGTTLTVAGANTYTWSPSTGLSSTVTAVVTASPATATTYTVTGTSAAGCINTASATVTVNGVVAPLTPGTIAADQTICNGATPNPFTSTTAAAGGTGSITYQWQQSINNVTFTNIPGATSATYGAGALTQTTFYRRVASTTVDAAVIAGPVTVTVLNPPVLGPITGPCALPKDSTKTFSVAAVPNATRYVWTLPNGWTGTSTTNSINATANNTGGTISVTAFNGNCQGNTVTYFAAVIDYTNVTISGLPVIASGNNNSAISITVTLYDVNGNKINCSGGVATVYTCDGNPATFTPVIDNNDGTYSTQLTASANDIQLCGTIGGIPVLKKISVTFTGPQGGIKPNGPIFDFETPKLTFTATAGRAPFTVIYRSPRNNKNDTVTNINSGTAIPAKLIPATTRYTLVSIIDANGERRDNNFNRDTATVLVVVPKVIITLKADPAKQEVDSSWRTRLLVKTKNIGEIDLFSSQARLNLSTVFPNPVTYVLDSVAYFGNTIVPNKKYEGVQNTDLFARVNTRKPDIFAKATAKDIYTNAYENTIPQNPDGSASVEIWGSTNKTDQSGNKETFTVTDEGDGSYMFGALSNLPVGVEADIILYLHVRPNGYTEPFVMQAVALGTGVTEGATSLATSLSNDNNDINAHPEITKQGDPIPTVINLFPRAVVGAALSAGTPVLQGNGTYNVLMSVKIKDYGNVNLTNVKLNLDLLKSIGLPSTFTVVGPITSTGTMIPNLLYNGKTDTSLLAAGNTLGYKQESVIQFTINITTNQLTSIYNLQASASGFSDDLSVTVFDLSNNGTDPDPDGNGVPSEKVITQIVINIPIPPLVPGTIGIQTGPTTTVPAKSFCGPTFGVVIIPTSLNTGGLSAYQYQWQSSADNISFQDIEGAADSTFTSGQVNNSFYLRRGTISGSQIKYSNSVYIQIFPVTKPSITASGPLVLTQNATIVLTSSAASSYLWSTTATTRSINVNLAGKYTVSTVDANGCSSVSDTVKIYPPPPVTVNATYIIGAINNPVNSGVQVTGLPGATLNYYILSTGGVLIPVPVLPGVIGVFTYYVSQTVNGFESILVPYTVTMIDKVSDVQKILSKAPVLQSDGSFLIGFTILSTNLRNELLDSVKIKDDLTKVFPASTQFQVVDIKASGKLIANGLYNGNSQIELLDNGSQLPGLKTDSVNLTIKMIPNGFSGTLNNVAIQTAKSPYGIFRVTSNDPTVGNGILVREPTKFIIPIIDIFIPSGFSPNQDGTNDKFVITKPFNTSISLDVFNRWGNLVFKAQDYKNEFDGKGNQPNRVLGEDLPDGTYYYIVVATNNANGTVRKFAGFITLKR
jgi:gliding motility-associated-like protein